MAETEFHDLLPLPEFEDIPPHLLIIVSPYYKSVADNLLEGAKTTLASVSATYDVAEVPGALEIPTAIRLASRDTTYDGFVALGCVIRGETTHYETVCTDSSSGLRALGLEGICIGNGILTVETYAQAEARANPKGQNKGGHAAAAALHLIALARRFQKSPKDIGFKPASEHIILADGPDDDRSLL